MRRSWWQSVAKGVALMAMLIGVGSSEAAGPRVYHVDFRGGSDEHDGLTPRAALKHAPGDPAATGKAQAVALQPGDTVLFKGGVVYRGNVVVTASGEAGRPIVFDGNTAGQFGQGRALLDGSEEVRGWQACRSAEEADGNPHWAQVYTAWLDTPVAPLSANVYQGDRMCWVAQDPNPQDPFYQDRPEGHRRFQEATADTITDPEYLTQADPHAWDGAWLVVYASPNYPYFVQVTGYDPAARRLTHSGKLEQPSSYAVLNVLRALDQPGEYVVRQEQGRTRLYLWPHSAADLEKHGASVTRRGTAFVVEGRQHVEIRGFMIQKYVAEDRTAMGVEVEKSSSVLVRDNEVRFGSHGRTGGVQHGAGIAVSEGQEVVLEGNRITDNRRCCGILVHPATRCVIRNNVVRKSGYVGIWLMRTTHSEVVGNTVTDNHGVHSNAISIYVDSSHILVAGNRVLRSDRPLTLGESNDLTIVNNLLVSDTSLAVGLWSGPPQRRLVFLNNVMLGPEDQGLYAVNKVVEDCVFENNIVGALYGGAPIDAAANTFRNNLYGDANRPLYHASEKYLPDLAALFVDPAKDDYHLRPNSPARGAGTDVSALYPRAAFPDYDFDKDLDGRPRAPGGVYDVGPYAAR
jgi:parallel beta-helix repeat protein